VSEKRCGNCKYLKPIISLMGDYYCFKNYRFFCIDDLSNVCDSFIFDELTLEMKEKRVW